MVRTADDSHAVVEHVLGASAGVDARSGEPLPLPLSVALPRALGSIANGRWPVPEDALVRTVSFLDGPLQRILAQPRFRSLRTRTPLEHWKVRDQDVQCLSWLARQPGRTTQDKLATLRRIQGVTREPGFDLPENRVVRRMMRQLLQLVEPRLALIDRGHYDSGANGRGRTALSAFRALATQGVERSPLRNAAEAIRIEPNNVLLSDPDYRRCWRVFQQLQRWEADRDAARAQRDLRLTACVAMLLLARFEERAEVFLEESPLEVSFRGPCTFGPVRGLCIPAGAEPLLLRVSLIQDTIELNVASLRGDRLLEACGVEEQVRISCAYRLSEEGTGGNGAAGVARIAHDGKVLELPFGVDAEGLRQVTGSLEAWCLGPRAEPGAVARPRDGTRTQVRRHVGWVLTEPYLESFPASEEPLLMVAQRIEGPDTSVCTGARAVPLFSSTRAHSSTGTTSFSSPRRLLDALLTQEDSAGVSGHERLVGPVLVRAVGEGWGCAPGGRLGLVVPDAVDEVTASVLRAQLPSSVGRSLFIPSSVAAVAAAEVAKEKPQACLVVDLDAPVATLVLLMRVRDEEDAEGRWVWDRSAPFLGRASHGWRRALAAAALACAGHAGPPERLEGLTPHLADSGLLDELRRGRPVWVPLPGAGDAFLVLRPEDLDLEVARQHADRDFVAGAGTLLEAHADDIRQSAGELPLEVLLAGEAVADAALAKAWSERIRQFLPDATVRASTGGASALARGAEEVARRFDAGKPTWRDTLPKLSLEVRSGRGTAWIELLDGKSRVRPDRTVSVKVADPLELPAGRDRIAFPLARDAGTDKGRGKRAAFRAELSGPEFPLREAIRVRLEVSYRYASDAFRVRLYPSGLAPFESLEFQWTRGEAASSLSRRDEPPQAPAMVSWDDEADVIERLAKQVTELGEQARKTFKGDPITASKNAKSAEALNAAIKELSASIHDLQPELKSLWTSTRTAVLTPRVAGLRDRIRAALVPLSGLPVPKKADLFKPSLWNAERVGKAMAGMANEALWALACLRRDAPPELLDRVTAEARKAKRIERQPWVEATGRLLGSQGGDAGLDALRFATDLLDEDARAGAMKLPLWALSTALWSGGPVAPVFSHPGVAHDVASRCERVLSRVRSDWASESVAGDLAAEAMIALLGLTRLRPGAPSELLTPGTERADLLAALVEEVGEMLADKPALTKPRLRLEDGGLPRIAAETLRGQTVALVRALEE